MLGLIHWLVRSQLVFLVCRNLCSCGVILAWITPPCMGEPPGTNTPMDIPHHHHHHHHQHRHHHFHDHHKGHTSCSSQRCRPGGCMGQWCTIRNITPCIHTHTILSLKGELLDWKLEIKQIYEIICQTNICIVFVHPHFIFLWEAPILLSQKHKRQQDHKIADI